MSSDSRTTIRYIYIFDGQRRTSSRFKTEKILLDAFGRRGRPFGEGRQQFFPERRTGRGYGSWDVKYLEKASPRIAQPRCSTLIQFCKEGWGADIRWQDQKQA